MLEGENLTLNDMYAFQWSNILKEFETNLVKCSDGALHKLQLRERFNTHRGIDTYTLLLAKDNAEKFKATIAKVMGSGNEESVFIVLRSIGAIKI